MLSSLETLESRLLAACVTPGHPGNPCYVAAQAHFSAGGARIRAQICLEAGLRLGVTPEDTLQLAVLCELLHNSSLIQDDLLDRTQLRRGKASVWMAFGETTAICLSDLMLSGAYASLSYLHSKDVIPAALALVHERTRDVILGQAVENLGDDGCQGALALYEKRARGKSSSLLSLPLELPLLVSGNPGAMQDAREAAGRFAIAYQISDDLEDLEQDEARGSLNAVHMLQSRQGLSQARAKSTAAAHALQLLEQSNDYAAKLPFDCAAVMASSAQKLAARLAAFEHPRLALAGD